MIKSGLLAGRQVELIDGQIINMAPELPIHRVTYRRGVKYLEALLGAEAVVFATAPVTLPSDGEPQPDNRIKPSTLPKADRLYSTLSGQCFNRYFNLGSPMLNKGFYGDNIKAYLGSCFKWKARVYNMFTNFK